METARNTKIKDNKEWILITMKAATERYFLKIATRKFRKCRG